MKTDQPYHEACGVFGVSLTVSEAAGITYNGLLSLQHRGQEGAGIAVVNDNNLFCCKNVGLVSEVFSAGTLDRLPHSRLAVGHTRYSTSGANVLENVGPFVTEYLTGRIATAHNGHISNAREIRASLMQRGLSFSSSSDSEVISSLIAYHITQTGRVVDGILRAAAFLDGSFSLIIASSDGLLLALRDPNGFRPLCVGRNQSGIAVASESCALEACGFKFVRDIRPGEMIVIEQGQIVEEAIWLDRTRSQHGLCIFEYVYFARPDSIIDGLSVYSARYNMGSVLALECPVAADVVCGVPDSGIEAACGYSAASGIPLVSGFVKNRYIGRSFIYPTQTERDSAVRLKLNPLAVNVDGKRVVLIDDSIVRGTTSRKIVLSLKAAGAKEVHVRISSPPFLHSCHYGTDVDREDTLIANKLSIEEICREIGADSLGYISIEGLKKACQSCSLPFCTVCFTGESSQAE